MKQILPALVFLAFLALAPLAARAQDSDSDGMPDAWEIAHPCLMPYVDDAAVDYDTDSIGSLAEYTYSPDLDPCAADTDGDGKDDGLELAHGSNPLLDFITPRGFGFRIGGDVRVGDRSISSGGPALVWSGSGYGLSWIDTLNRLNFARLASDGQVLGVNLRASSVDEGMVDSDVVWTGSEFGMVWNSTISGGFWGCDSNYLHFTRILPSGEVGPEMDWGPYEVIPVGPPPVDGCNAQVINFSGLFWSGSEYAIGYNNFIMRLNSTGEVLSSTTVPVLADDIGVGWWYLVNDVSWNGSEYTVCAGGLFSRVTTGGEQLDGTGIPNACNERMVFQQGWFQAPSIWNSIELTPISPVGIQGPGKVVLPSTTSGAAPFLVGIGDGFILAWEDSRDGNKEIYSALLDADGDMIGAEVRMTSTVGASTMPVMAWTGSEMGMVWNEPGGLFFTRIGGWNDSDGDGLGQDQETAAGADPDNWDTDGDGMGDGYEVEHVCLDPLVADGDADADGDGLINRDEFLAQTDACAADSDGDGLIDSEEIVLGADPLEPDTDGDGLTDGWEAGVVVGVGPNGALDTTAAGDDVIHNGAIWLGPNLVPDTAAAGDDLQVIPLAPGCPRLYLTDPLLADSDTDGVDDNFEVMHGSDPLSASVAPSLVNTVDAPLTHSYNQLFWTGSEYLGLYDELIVTPQCAADTTTCNCNLLFRRFDRFGRPTSDFRALLSDVHQYSSGKWVDGELWINGPTGMIRLDHTGERIVPDHVVPGTWSQTDWTGTQIMGVQFSLMNHTLTFYRYGSGGVPLGTTTLSDPDTIRMSSLGAWTGSEYGFPLPGYNAPSLFEFVRLAADGSLISRQNISDMTPGYVVYPVWTGSEYVLSFSEGYNEVNGYSCDPGWETCVDQTVLLRLDAQGFPVAPAKIVPTPNSTDQDDLMFASRIDWDGSYLAQLTPDMSRDSDGACDATHCKVDVLLHWLTPAGDDIAPPRDLGQVNSRWIQPDRFAYSLLPAAGSTATAAFKAFAPDSDGDGLVDEVESGCLSAFNYDSDGDGVSDTLEDPDLDGLVGAADPAPCAADGDGDGITDVDEIALGADALATDSDHDGMDDPYEMLQACLDPVFADDAADPDADGLASGGEQTAGTDPCDPDTDNDGLTDGWENTWSAGCMDPLVAGSTVADPDLDSLTNLQENALGTNPCAADTDADASADNLDCAPLDPNNWNSCGTCTDADGDGWFTGCNAYTTINGPDCDDANAHSWNTCATCVDADADGWFGVCNSYTGISGPDCDDANLNAWNTCATCVDADADGWFLVCNTYTGINGHDCSDGNPNAWDTCDTCKDNDGDAWYAGCNQYLTVNGPDCSDTNKNTWDTCAACLDSDGDTWYAGCNQYVTINGPDCSDADNKNWTMCATCIDTDGDNYKGTGCNVSSDCNDLNTNVWTTCGTCVDVDGDTWYAGCNRYVTVNGPDCNDASARAWNTCATCKDGDADGWYGVCNDYTGISGPDCDDANHNAFNTCGTCVDADLDNWYLLCNNYDPKIALVTTGAGGSSWSHPFRTSSHDARTQSIYWASEVGPAGVITALALDVTTIPGQVMNNFTIRLKHTSKNSLSPVEWDGPDSGWTTVYQANAERGTTGWRTFTFTTPFVYNGTSNLMVDFSFNNSSASSSGSVRYSNGYQRSVTGTSNSLFGDPLNWTGNNSPGPSSSSFLANLRFTVSHEIHGPDCNDADPYNWTMCATCADADGDGRNGNCDLPADCNDSDPRIWDTCATCADLDGDEWYGVCNDYTGISGPDCDDLDPLNWTLCATCVDPDGDGHKGTGCNISADCSESNHYAWTACATCLDADSDGWIFGVCDTYTAADVLAVGNGTDASEFPLATGYQESRSQVIYLASELGPAATINALAFEVTLPPPLPLQNFTIRMKHTPLSAYTVAAWDGPASGWTTVYQGTLTVSGAGWQDIALATPFAYNGTDNLMVDFSFDNPAASTYGYVRFTNRAARALHFSALGDYGDPLGWNGASPAPVIGPEVPNLSLSLAYHANGPDCNDAAITVFPGAPEACDTIDNQCPGDSGYGMVDEGCPPPDADGDGLTYGEEVIIGTDPNKWDTDGDGLSDKFEADNMTGHETGKNLAPLTAADGAADFDGDGILNAHEYWNSTSLWATNPAGYVECGYWGESDGDGWVTGNDRDTMLSASIGNPTDYSNVFPPTGETQDLDGDGWFTGNDVDLLDAIMIGADTPVVQSRPAALEAIDTCAATLQVGDTCHVSVAVLNSRTPTAGRQAGIAVVFTVDPSSTGSATIFGGEGAGDVGGRYDLSTSALSSPAGVSRAVVRADAAGTVKITARVPPCGTEVGVGRSSAEIILPTFATVTVP